MPPLLHAFLDRVVRKGTLEVETSSGTRFAVGDGSGKRIDVRLADSATARQLLLRPELALGELYTDGRLTVTQGSIYDLIVLLGCNLGVGSAPGLARVYNKVRKTLRPPHHRNTARRAMRNVAHHYDVSGALYRLFLDPDMQYSCAYFEHSGARVTSITLSEAQLAYSCSRASERGLTNCIDFQQQDYRAIGGNFDRIVSVGMFEHVGLGYCDAFFAKVAELLADDGVMLLHSIGRGDGPGPTNSWVEKYILPGGYVPALSEVLPAWGFSSPTSKSSGYISSSERLTYAGLARVSLRSSHESEISEPSLRDKLRAYLLSSPRQGSCFRHTAPTGALPSFKCEG